MARSLAGQLLALGAERGDEIASLTGYVDLGVACCWTGEYRAARDALEKGVAICERLLPGCPEPFLGHVKLQLIYGLENLLWTLWMLGYPEQALHRMEMGKMRLRQSFRKEVLRRLRRAA
jgi:hypothetical protein